MLSFGLSTLYQFTLTLPVFELKFTFGTLPSEYRLLLGFIFITGNLFQNFLSLPVHPGIFKEESPHQNQASSFVLSGKPLSTWDRFISHVFNILKFKKKKNAGAQAHQH